MSIDKKIKSIKYFIHKYRTPLAVGTAVAGCYVIHTAVVNAHDEFLKEHDLYDEFYNLNLEEF